MSRTRLGRLVRSHVRLADLKFAVDRIDDRRREVIKSSLPASHGGAARGLPVVLEKCVGPGDPGVDVQHLMLDSGKHAHRSCRVRSFSL